MSNPLFNSGQDLGRQRKIFFKEYWESIVLYDIKSPFVFQESMYEHQGKKQGVGGMNWEVGIDIYTLLGKIYIH